MSMRKIGEVLVEEIILNITPPETHGKILCKIKWNNKYTDKPGNIEGIYIKIDYFDITTNDYTNHEYIELHFEDWDIIKHMLRGDDYLTYFDFPGNKLITLYNGKTINDLFYLLKNKYLIK